MLSLRAGWQSVQPHARGAAFGPLRSELRSTRNPMLLFVFVGLLLLRFATRLLLALLFQLPPRYTRLVPDDCRPKFS